MTEGKIKIINRLGLHARAAAKLVHAAGNYSSEVKLVFEEEEVDAKSILGILQLGAAQGSTLMLRCDGEDEKEAYTTVSELIADRFGEES